MLDTLYQMQNIYERHKNQSVYAHTLYLRRGWSKAEAERYILLIFTSFDSWTEVKLNMETLLWGGVLLTTNMHIQRQRVYSLYLIVNEQDVCHLSNAAACRLTLLLSSYSMMTIWVM